MSDSESDHRKSKGKSQRRAYDSDTEEERLPARGKGKQRINHSSEDSGDDQGYDSGERRRSPPPRRSKSSKSAPRIKYDSRDGSEDESANERSRKSRGARKDDKSKSKALVRTGTSKKSGRHRDNSDDEEMITMTRYDVLSWQDLQKMPGMIDSILAPLSEMTLGALRNYCEKGYVRWDNKLDELNLDKKLLEMYPKYQQKRWEHDVEVRREEKEKKKDTNRGSQMPPARDVFVPVIVPVGMPSSSRRRNRGPAMYALPPARPGCTNEPWCGSRVGCLRCLAVYGDSDSDY